ncbi:DSS1/SEM1 family-domain-containing protein [Tirmania nivea]|nr:DSS1/SEM1 family-domain-containing protein [Tirmania nivea]
MSSAKQSTSTGNNTAAAEAKPEKPTNHGFSLEEDDEFEDFPVEDWEDTESEQKASKANLWEESWDDDDTSDDFAEQLRVELKKVEGK